MKQRKPRPVKLAASMVCGHKPWVAAIVGTDKEYYFKRKFLVPKIKDETHVFSLEVGGLFEVKTPTGSRSSLKLYVVAEKNGLRRLTSGAAMSLAVKMDEGRKTCN